MSDTDLHDMFGATKGDGNCFACEQKRLGGSISTSVPSLGTKDLEDGDLTSSLLCLSTSTLRATKRLSFSEAPHLARCWH